MFRRFTLFFGTLFLIINLKAQFYQPIDTADSQQRKDFLKYFKDNNNALIKKFSSEYSGKTASELDKFYSEFYSDFEKGVKDKEYTFKSPFEAKINSILSEIQKSNPEISGNLKILIAKDNTPNAACLADGTFIINMGIFNWMDNEEQIAGILCHELGHKIKNHVLQSLVSDINQEKSDKETAKNINLQKERKYDKAFDIVKNKLYKKLGDKRKKEMQADSLGYVFYRNTKFKKQEYINAMGNLRDFDSISPRELKIDTYKKLYDLPQQSFKDKWMKKEDFSLYNYDLYKEKLNKDSLSTHPEMIKRMAVLKQEFPELNSSETSKESDEIFKKLKKTARMEILPNFYNSQDYGLGVYVAMQFLQDQEEEEYNKFWVGRFFDKIYDARKNYNLNRYLDRVDPKNQSESYQQFLNFIWNLSLDEIKNIADFYNKKGTS